MYIYTYTVFTALIYRMLKYKWSNRALHLRYASTVGSSVHNKQVLTEPTILSNYEQGERI